MTSDTTQGKADQAKEEGKHLTEEAREKGAAVGREAKAEAERVVDEVRSEARSQADDQARRAAGALRGVADQLHSMADGTSERGMIVDMAREGGDRIQQLADHLDEDGVRGLVDDVENFARQRPGLFIAAGVGVGMLVGRAIKAGGSAMQEDHVYDIRDEAVGDEAGVAARPVAEPAGAQTTGGFDRPGRQL